MDKKMLDRINELAKKKKEQGLTEAEQKEQKELYKIYLGEIRTQFNATLDNVSVEENRSKRHTKSRMTKTDFDIQTEVMRKFNYTVKQKSSSDFGTAFVL